MQCYLDHPMKSKKAIKEAVAAGKEVSVWGYKSPFETGIPEDGKGHTLVGPAPYDRKYYAQITVKNGCITAIK